MFFYIDPGVGSILFQAAAAGVIAVAVFFRQIRNWVSTRILHRRNHDRN